MGSFERLQQNKVEESCQTTTALIFEHKIRYKYYFLRLYRTFCIHQNQVNDGSDSAVDVHTDYSSMSTSEAGCGSISEGFHAAKSTALQTPGLSGSLEDEETANDNSVPSRGPASASFHNSTQKRADQFQSSQTTTNGDSLRTFVPTRGQFNNVGGLN